MKRTNKLFLLLLLIAPVFFACERDLESEGVSRVVFFPEITVEGAEVMSVQQGGTFTDPGAKATEGGAVLPVTTLIEYTPYITPGQADPSKYTYGFDEKSAVDTNTPGMYVIHYGASNQYGEVSARRFVFVLTKPVNPAVDLTGTYTSGTSPAATISRVAPGVYFSTNAWGGGSTVVIPAYLVSPDGVDVNVPYQESLVPIYGYGQRLANGNLDLRMTRPTFATPLFDQVKVFVKQ